MRNEARFIEACIRSIVDQRYLAGQLEILVYDGGSTDDSRERVAAIAATHPEVVLLDNPRRIQAAGWNLGIARATGDIIGIVGAHSELAPDYVATAVETLARTGADMVGGPMRAVSDGPVGTAAAIATSSPFGVGGARFHYTETEEDVDTVYMGLCRSEVYRSLLFDEEMVRNQDDELSYRLLDQGGRIVCNPRIRSTYHNRATWSGLARQYFEYGFWKIRVLRKHPRQARLRHVIPAALVVSLAGSAALAVVARPGRVLFATAVSTYVVATIGASIVATPRMAFSRIPTVAACFATLHLSYGVGFLAGLGSEVRRRAGHRDHPA
jgi:glycosyltransferase involved in cell wall biosynthesis